MLLSSERRTGGLWMRLALTHQTKRCRRLFDRFGLSGSGKEGVGSAGSCSTMTHPPLFRGCPGVNGGTALPSVTTATCVRAFSLRLGGEGMYGGDGCGEMSHQRGTRTSVMGLPVPLFWFEGDLLLLGGRCEEFAGRKETVC